MHPPPPRSTPPATLLPSTTLFRSHHTPVPPRALIPRSRNDRPSVCPHCEADWSRMTSSAPIRTQRTGFQKVAQVLSDSLLREIAPPEVQAGRPVEDPRRKLVLFSDSRQDAAKLAVGVAKSHWLDAIDRKSTRLNSSH